MSDVAGVTLVGEIVRLRPLREADRDRVVEMRSMDAIAIRWRGDDLAAEFDADLADEDLHQFAIEAAGEVVGMIQCSEEDDDPDYRHATIDLYVDPAHHRRGFASDAIRTLADHLFDDRGHHRITIDPAVDNLPAIACYRGVGFRDVGVMRAYERRQDGSWSDGLLLDMLATDRSPRPVLREAAQPRT